MLVNYSDQEVIKGQKSIFLAGPTPRDKNIKSWREYAIKKLEELGFDGVVYVPEFSDMKPKENYIDQANWERTALTEATVIMFWIPRSFPDMKGLTTNVEFGYWIHTDKVLYGRPDDSCKNKYLDWLYGVEFNKKPFNDLFDLLLESMNLASKLHRIKKTESKLSELMDKCLEEPSKFFEMIASNLSTEEYLYIKSMLINKSCENCINSSCDVENYDKIGINEYGKPIGSDCVGWQNRKLVGKSKVLRKNNIHEL